MVILYTLNKNSYIDIKELADYSGITCYVNSTNRCNCACTFCLRNTKEMAEENSLWLEKEPTVNQIIDEFKKYDLKKFKEVVFCGFGIKWRGKMYVGLLGLFGHNYFFWSFSWCY